MTELTLSDYILIGVVALFVIGKFFKAMGWDRGAFIADELQDALRSARVAIAGARLDGGADGVAKASEAVAAKVKGVSAEDVKPVVEKLVQGVKDSRYGVTVQIDKGGNIQVDPSGAVAGAAHKISKFWKKVF